MADYYDLNSETNSSGVTDPTEVNIVDDLSVIPLEKDSFSICELCGRIGRKTQFYTRNSKYCSLRCFSSAVRRRHCNWRFKMMESTEHMAGMIPLEPLPQLQSWHTSFNDIQTGPIKHTSAMIANSYEWKDELFGCDFLAAPVSLFKHAPLHDMWDNTFEGMKVEVKNTDCENYSEKLGDYFWVATVLKVKGYMGLLRYEGFGSDDTKDFWVNLCLSEVHPVGWCATRGKPLIPPKTIEDKYTDWKKFLVKQLTGARTLPANFYNKLNESLKSRFSVGTVMEVVDKNRISQVKVASVHEIIGKRLHVKYYDSTSDDVGFWCHEDSPLIHPVGWAFQVGHPLEAPQAYCQRVAAGRYQPNDATPDMFLKYPASEPPLFTKGMKLEAIDPLNLSAVCAATVMQVLHDGYMMIRVDCYPADTSGSDWFCYHQRSPCIFPVGFSLANKIPMVPPLGYTADNFNWEEYLVATKSEAAGAELFASSSRPAAHGFVAGMRLECADLMDPRLVCVATIARVVAGGHLLKVHFDGWGDEYDQWLPALSPDMYPVGWARATRHRLEGPLQSAPARPPRPPKAPRRSKCARPPKRRRQPRPSQAALAAQVQEQPLDDVQSDAPETKCASPLTSSSEVSCEVPGDVDSAHSEVSQKESEKMEVENEIKEEEPQPKDEKSETGQQPAEEATSTPTDTTVDSSPQDASPIVAQDLPEEPIDEPANEAIEEPIDEPSDKVIPRLVNKSVPLDVLNSIDPENWTTADVAKFLTVNDCQPYCVNFSNITGTMMLQLTKDEIIELLEMKVGPSLKIFDLIQQLKCKIKQPQNRLLNSFK